MGYQGGGHISHKYKNMVRVVGMKMMIRFITKGDGEIHNTCWRQCARLARICIIFRRPDIVFIRMSKVSE